ncbi:vomeronasal type-1 receptor 2-like [Mastomys coucha]|uniref:vomeronasal type-1 receptor 2-like n=1 Tax=Mastomys coucha TaxID=35658 RepID=UPI001261B169|nr:vomeronasal type-1 receptor 2-like [Mastomys coucha]
MKSVSWHILQSVFLSNNMDARNLGIGIIFLLQSTVGILGNISILSYYLVIFYKKHKGKPMDLILVHMIIVNILIILSKGVPSTMTAFGLKLFFNDWSYQFFMYVLRVSRSMSIVTICLLSVFQTIIIIPRNSCWKNLRAKSPKGISLCISLSWVLYIFINVIFPLYMSVTLSEKNITEGTNFKLYTIVGYDKITVFLYITFFVFPEILFSGLITWSSSSMIVILYRHKQRVQYIRSTHASHSSSPESRAIQNILVLVFTFLTFYTLSAISHTYNALFHYSNWWLINFTAIITLCIPTSSPFVLMSQSFPLSKLCFL